MSADPIWLACSPADHPASASGCVKRRCAECNRQVWVAPATVALMQHAAHGPRCRPLCMEHFAEHVLRKTLLEGAQAVEYKTTAQQEREMFIELGKTTREIYAELGIEATLLDDKEPD